VKKKYEGRKKEEWGNGVVGFLIGSEYYSLERKNSHDSNP